MYNILAITWLRNHYRPGSLTDELFSKFHVDPYQKRDFHETLRVVGFLSQVTYTLGTYLPCGYSCCPLSGAAMHIAIKKQARQKGFKVGRG